MVRKRLFYLYGFMDFFVRFFVSSVSRHHSLQNPLNSDITKPPAGFKSHFFFLGSSTIRPSPSETVVHQVQRPLVFKSVPAAPQRFVPSSQSKHGHDPRPSTLPPPPHTSSTYILGSWGVGGWRRGRDDIYRGWGGGSCSCLSVEEPTPPHHHPYPMSLHPQ